MKLNEMSLKSKDDGNFILDVLSLAEKHGMSFDELQNEMLVLLKLLGKSKDAMHKVLNSSRRS